MSDNEKKRRFASLGEIPLPDRNRKFDPGAGAMNVVGQMLGGLGAGLGQGIAQKMNDRTMLAAAAMQGIIEKFYEPSGQQVDNPHAYGHTFNDLRSLAVMSVAAADAVLARLDEVEDPRMEKAKDKAEAASIGVVP